MLHEIQKLVETSRAPPAVREQYHVRNLIKTTNVMKAKFERVRSSRNVERFEIADVAPV